MKDNSYQRVIFAFDGAFGYGSSSQHHAVLAFNGFGIARGRKRKDGLMAVCGSQRSVFAVSARPTSHQLRRAVFVDRNFDHLVDTTAFITALFVQA